VAGYVIRGGEEGKARLSVLSAALAPSTASLLGAAGVREGIRVLDLGCGGGDVTLALAHLVGAQGAVVGIDVDDVSLGLARKDAADARIEHLEYRIGDATDIDARDEYDVVYARFLLTHLAEPAATLARMVAATRPGGVVVVEDLDHSAVYSYPALPALADYVELYNEVARRRGGDPEIGPKLLRMFRMAGLVDVEVRTAQPVFVDGPPKRFHQITLENVRDSMEAEGVATAATLGPIAVELEAFCAEPDTIVAFPRIFQVFGRRPG
jgi:SAM-dependent methyltransferase